MNPNQIVLSVPTSGSGATPGATFSFSTSGYKPPRQGRSLGTDIVHNQNGAFKYVYDNGPNFWAWDPFEAVLTDQFSGVSGGGATQQYANLRFLWNYVGVMGIRTPDGAYNVVWAAGADFQQSFQQFPNSVGDKMEFRVTLNIEEAL